MDIRTPNIQKSRFTDGFYQGGAFYTVYVFVHTEIRAAVSEQEIVTSNDFDLWKHFANPKLSNSRSHYYLSCSAGNLLHLSFRVIYIYIIQNTKQNWLTWSRSLQYGQGWFAMLRTNVNQTYGWKVASPSFNWIPVHAILARLPEYICPAHAIISPGINVKNKLYSVGWWVLVQYGVFLRIKECIYDHECR